MLGNRFKLLMSRPTRTGRAPSSAARMAIALPIPLPPPVITGTLFEVGKEVIAYSSIEECAEQMRYYLDHPQEREAIALAGQKRTLQEHTYWHRAQQLADMAKRNL